MRATATGGHPRSIVVPKGLQMSQLQALGNQYTAHGDAIPLASMHSYSSTTGQKCGAWRCNVCMNACLRARKL